MKVFSKAAKIVLVTMIVFGAVTFLNINSKADDIPDCACYMVDYFPGYLLCHYKVCLPSYENPSDFDYAIYVWDPHQDEWDNMYLALLPDTPCDEGCTLYEGWFEWRYFPEVPTTWYVYDNRAEKLFALNSELRSCL
jgi:hypothetical protein